MTGDCVKLYGIKNCDTVKKARRWLDARGLAFAFHDLREDGLSKDMVDQWLAKVPADTLLNKRSATWKNLDAKIRDNLQAGDIPDLLVTNPTLVKRPVLDNNGDLTVGFSEKTYSALFDL